MCQFTMKNINNILNLTNILKSKFGMSFKILWWEDLSVFGERLIYVISVDEQAIG